MVDDQRSASRRASRLQEAIDTIVQSFEYPETLSINHTFEGGHKRTTFEVQTGEGILTYELVHDSPDDETEPELRCVG